MKRNTRSAAVVWAVMGLLGAAQAGYGEAGAIVGWGAEVVPHDMGTGYAAVAAGVSHSLALKADGSIVAWGAYQDGQCNVPAPNTDFVAVAASGYHSLGLKVDGSIVAWGENEHGQCNVPTPNTDFAAIATGSAHTLALKADGSIVAWGCGPGLDFGQCNPPPGGPNTDFVAVAAGMFHSLGLKADGSIVAWGCSEAIDWGQCDVPEPNADFVAVTAGGRHSLGLIGVFGDVNVDNFVDLNDFGAFGDCLSGPGVLPPRSCTLTRIDGDWDVDLADFAAFQTAFSPSP